MLRTLKYCLIIFVAAWAMVMLPAQAMAQGYSLLQCDGSGNVESDTKLYDDEEFCAHVGSDRIFSNVICSFISILNSALGKMYCGMQHTLQGIVGIIITLYLAVFGAQIVMGVTALNAKEILIRLLKISLVWAFVSQSGWAITMLFVFFTDFANQSILWTLGSIGTVADDMGVTPGDNISGVMPAYTYIDQFIYDAISGPFTEANAKLVGFFAAMAFAFPPIFMIAAYWLWTTFMIFARTFIGFLMSLSAIAFLIAISPIFFCLMLFQATYQFFEVWLKYLISYSLQMMIVFAIVALWITAMLNFVGFFDQLSSVVFPYKKVEEGGPVAKAADSVGICPYTITTGGTLIGPNVACVDPGFNPEEYDASGQKTADARQDTKNLIALSNQAPSQTEDEEDNPNSACNDETGGPGTPQCRLNQLNYYVIYHLITLIIIAYAFDALLKRAPYIAKELSGPQYVPVLGQGFGGLGYHQMRGVSKTTDRSRSAVSGSGNAVDDFIRNARNLRGRPAGPS